MSGYSAEVSSSKDGGSSADGEELPRPPGDREYPEMPPVKRKRKTPGEWVIKVRSLHTWLRLPCL
jgi:hypothetical protein